MFPSGYWRTSYREDLDFLEDFERFAGRIPSIVSDALYRAYMDVFADDATRCALGLRLLAELVQAAETGALFLRALRDRGGSIRQTFAKDVRIRIFVEELGNASDPLDITAWLAAPVIQMPGSEAAMALLMDLRALVRDPDFSQLWRLNNKSKHGLAVRRRRDVHWVPVAGDSQNYAVSRLDDTYAFAFDVGRARMIHAAIGQLSTRMLRFAHWLAQAIRAQAAAAGVGPL